jgi:hypothetical protein
MKMEQHFKSREKNGSSTESGAAITAAITTKQQQIEWRRSRVLELSSQGRTELEPCPFTDRKSYSFYLIPPRGSASPVLLLTSLFFCKVEFEAVGVDLPIRVSLTSSAGVIMVVLFSVIVGTI